MGQTLVLTSLVAQLWHVLVLVGRVLFVVLFPGSAVAHLTKTAMLAGYAEGRGVPAAEPMVFAGGLLLLAGGLSVLLGVWIDLGALLLVVFLIPTAVVMHGFWRESDPRPGRWSRPSSARISPWPARR